MARARDCLKRSYWGSNGKHQTLVDKFEALQNAVPKGRNKWVDLSRAAAKVYYDCHNNGGCNLFVYRDEVATILRHRDEIVAKMGKAGEASWVGIMGLLERHSNRSDGPYLPKTWSMGCLEQVMDALVLVVDEKYIETPPEPPKPAAVLESRMEVWTVLAALKAFRDDKLYELDRRPVWLNREISSAMILSGGAIDELITRLDHAAKN